MFQLAKNLAYFLVFTVVSLAAHPPAQAQYLQPTALKVYPISARHVAVGDSAGTYLEVGEFTQLPSVPSGSSLVRFELNGKTYRIDAAKFRKADGIATWGANALAAVKAFNSVTPVVEELTATKTYAASTIRSLYAVVTAGTATFQTGSDAAVAAQGIGAVYKLDVGTLISKTVTITPAGSSKVTVVYY